MNRINTFIIILLLLFSISSCKKEKNNENNNDDNNQDINEEANKDTIPPLFLEASGEYLPTVEIELGTTIDLYKDIRVIDNISKNVDLKIVNLDIFDNNRPGNYELIYEAKDEAGNVETVKRTIKVLNVNFKTIDAFVIDDVGYEYTLNSEDCLKSTSSGAKFRTSDTLHVMTKEHFINSYNLYCNDYTKNGSVVFFPYGALLITDEEFNFKLLRVSTSAFEVDVDGNLIENAFPTSQSNSGGGIFNGIIDVINNIIPDGGYIIFAATAGDNTAKNFLINNLFCSTYTTGALNKSSFDVKPTTKKIMIDHEFKQKTVIESGTTEIMGQINKTDYMLNGIPVTTYNYGDGKKKPVCFFFHGFGGDHVGGIMDKGDELAKRGFFVVAFDAYLHGGRTTEWFKSLTYGEKQKEIVNIQIQTANDAVMLFEKYFKYDDRVDPSNVYCMGVSMGAGTAFYFTSICEKVKGMISIVGSPSFVDFYQEKQAFYKWKQDEYYYQNLNYYPEYDPLINYKRLDGKYIYMANGTLDTTVPKKFAESLCTKLNKDYYKYEEYNVGHTSTVEMLNNAYDYLVNVRDNL